MPTPPIRRRPRRRPLPGRTVALLVLGPSMLACEGPADHDASAWSTTDSAGVTLVEQTLDPELRIALDEVWRIGSLDGDDATQFFTPRDGQLAEGRVYVLDSGNHRVKVFDQTDGSYLFGFGSQGSGPGEFEQLATRMTLDEGKIVVLDAGRRIHTYGLDGAHLGTVSTGTLVAPGTFVGMPAFDGSRWVTYLSRYYDMERGEALQTQPSLAYWLDLEAGEIGDSTGLAWEAGEEYESVGSAGWVVRPLYEPRIRWWFDGRGRLLRVLGDDYAWEVVAADGRLLRRVVNRYERVPVEADAAARYQADQEQRCRERPNSECERFIAEAVPYIAELPLPEFKPPIYQFDDTGDGHILVLRADLGWDLVDAFRSKTYDVFDPDGRFRGRFTRPPTFRVLAMDADHILAIERDDLDVESVVLYRWGG